jgi:hypothetical protein
MNNCEAIYSPGVANLTALLACGDSYCGASCSMGGTGTAVTFSFGQAQGVMTGYGWIAMGAYDTVVSPTCGTTAMRITQASPCLTQTNWNSSTALCISGSIPMVTGTPPDYTDNWGLQIGVNATADIPSGTIGQSFSTIAFNTIGSVVPTGAAIRAEIHRLGDSDATVYCANMVPGVPIALTAFNTACWDGTGIPLRAVDVPNIDKVGVQVSSDTTSPYTVTNFCLTGITFE